MEKTKVQAVIDGIGVVTELLYQEKFTEGYARLSSLLREMIALTADITDEAEQAAFVAVLQPALEAMEAQDATLLADILQYDLVTKLEEYVS